MKKTNGVYSMTIAADTEFAYDGKQFCFILNKLLKDYGWEWLVLDCRDLGESYYPEYEEDDDDYEPYHDWVVWLDAPRHINPLTLWKIFDEMFTYECYPCKVMSAFVPDEDRVDIERLYAGFKWTKEE